MSSEAKFQAARNFLAAVATHANEYAGIPIGIDGFKLKVHPKYRFAEIFNTREVDDNEGATVINSWISRRLRCQVLLWKEADGKRYAAPIPMSPVKFALNTLGVSCAWDSEAEAKAYDKLASLLKPHAFHHYLMTGTFLETSKRSKVTYLFRRLRPTLAINARAGAGEASPLCALCLHPIGYYEDSWGGAMVPTDDVIAHLMLMRGDEHGFWKQANQHPFWHPGAGL